MRLIAECSQQLVRLGENLWGKELELDKEMQEHQKLCDEIMAIQGIEPIEAEMEQIIHCPDDYIFKDENGNVINATKIVLEKKKKEYPKTYAECCKVMNYCCNPVATKTTHKEELIRKFQFLLLYRDAYWKIAGEKMGLGKPWEPQEGVIYSYMSGAPSYIRNIFPFPTAEMRDAFYENFKELIETVKELL